MKFILMKGGKNEKVAIILSVLVGVSLYFNFAYGCVAYQWTVAVGGSNSDTGKSVTVDSNGNIYTTGFFTGTVDFDPSAGTDNHTAFLEDAYITKYNSDGTYSWTKTVDSVTGSQGRAVVVDGSGNIYVTGSFTDTADFIPDPVNTDNKNSAGSADIFLTKIYSDGSYGWTKSIGGPGDDLGISVTLDNAENLYLTGGFSGSVDFNPDSGTDIHTSSGSLDIFLTSIGSDGSYGCTKTIGGTDFEGGTSVTAYNSDKVYITGMFNGTVNFDPGSGTGNRTSAGGEDIFLSKYEITSDLIDLIHSDFGG
jgi:hypothetical protein